MAITHPPGPRDWSFGFKLAQGIKHRLVETYFGLQRDFGDRVYRRVGPYRLYFFFHPDDVHDVLVTHSKTIIRDPRPLRVFAQWNGNSLLIAEGEQWKRQRRMVQPAFQSRRFAVYADKMSLAIDELAQSLRQAATPTGFTDVDIDQAMTALTLDIICQTMFSTDLKSRMAEFSKAVATLSPIAFYEIQQPWIWPRWLPTAWNRRKNGAVKVLDETVWDLVRKRRQEHTDRGDLLSMLLAAVDEEGDGGSMTDEQVRNECMTLILGGHDTSAAGLDWLWMLLAQHPVAASRCREEIASACGDREPGFSDLAQLPYLTAVIKEALRMYPPAIGVLLRMATEDVTIGGYLVPKGSLISLSSMVTQRDARWFPDPDRFDPERFLPPRVEQIPHGAWFPFGMGPRVCIGQSFAMTEMQLIAARLLQRFDVSIPPGQPPAVPHVTTAMRPKDQLLIRFVPR